MKTTRIDIEGPLGSATIRRDGEAVPVGEAFQLEADARETGLNGQVARTLQAYLDGHRGTAGDVAEYQRAIGIFED